MMGFFFYNICDPNIFFIKFLFISVFFLLCCLYFVFMYTIDFYCNLSYSFGFDNISFGLVLLSFMIISFMIFCSITLINSMRFFYFN